MVVAAFAVFALIVVASYSFYHASSAALTGDDAVAVSPQNPVPLNVEAQIAALVRPRPTPSHRAAPRPPSRFSGRSRPPKGRRSRRLSFPWRAARTTWRDRLRAALEIVRDDLVGAYAEMFAPPVPAEITAQRLDVPFAPGPDAAHHIVRPLALVYRSTVYVGTPFNLVLYILAPSHRGADLIPDRDRAVAIQKNLAEALTFDAAEEDPLLAVTLAGKDAEFGIDAAGGTLVKRLGPDDLAFRFLIKPLVAQACILTLTIAYVIPSVTDAVTESTLITSTPDAPTSVQRGTSTTTNGHATQSYPVMSVAIPIAVKTIAGLSAAQLQGVRWIGGTVVLLAALGFFLTIAAPADKGVTWMLGILAIAGQLGLPVSDKLAALLPKTS